MLYLEPRLKNVRQGKSARNGSFLAVLLSRPKLNLFQLVVLVGEMEPLEDLGPYL